MFRSMSLISKEPYTMGILFSISVGTPPALIWNLTHCGAIRVTFWYDKTFHIVFIIRLFTAVVGLNYRLLMRAICWAHGTHLLWSRHGIAWCYKLANVWKQITSNNSETELLLQFYDSRLRFNYNVQVVWAIRGWEKVYGPDVKQWFMWKIKAQGFVVVTGKERWHSLELSTSEYRLTQWAAMSTPERFFRLHATIPCKVDKKL